MRKLFFLLLLVSVSINVFGKSDTLPCGVVGEYGVNHTDYNDFGYVSGIRMGVLCEKKRNILMVSSGVILESRTYGVRLSDTMFFDYSAGLVTVPLIGSLKFGNRYGFVLDAGLYTSFVLTGVYYVEMGNYNEITFSKDWDLRNRFELGIMLGGGIDVKVHKNIDLVFRLRNYGVLHDINTTAFSLGIRSYFK